MIVATYNSEVESGSLYTLFGTLPRVCARDFVGVATLGQCRVWIAFGKERRRRATFYNGSRGILCGSGGVYIDGRLACRSRGDSVIEASRRASADAGTGRNGICFVGRATVCAG